MTTLSLRACLTNIGEPAKLPLRIPHDPRFGGRLPAGLRAAMIGMTDPGVSQWNEVGLALYVENTDWSEEAQGVTTDGTNWYLCSNNTKEVYTYAGTSRVADYGMNKVAKYSFWQDEGAPNADVGDDGLPKFGGTFTAQNGMQLPPPVPPASPPTWDVHFGAPHYHDPAIYVPVQGIQARGVWRIDLKQRGQQWFKAPPPKPEDPDTDQWAWCAFHPITGILYTCNYAHPALIKGYQLSGSTLSRSPQDDIQLGPRPLDVDRVQGGVFTQHGRLILVRSDFNAVFCFSSINGHCFGAKELGDWDHGASEVEAVTIRSWQFKGVLAQVHISELDNDWPDSDDFYLHSFQVPTPENL